MCKTPVLKKFFAAAAVAVAALCARADDSAYISGYTWTYTKSGNAATLTSVTPKPTGVLAIPAQIETGVDVTILGQDLFSGASELTQVKIPDTVTTIGQSAFYGCSTLVKVEIPASVTSIEVNAFADCAALAELTLPDSVIGIGTAAFSGCTSLTSVKLPGYVEILGDSVFAGCTALEEAHLPKGLEGSLGNYMFQNCKNLTGVYFPGPDSGSSTAQIRRSSCFKDCISLEVFLAGPLTRLSNNYGATSVDMFSGVNGCRIFVPTGSNWDTESDTEKGLAAYEADNTIFYYGAGRDLDMSFDNDNKTVTATPATAHALTNVLAAASTVKNVFGMDMRINVTNAIEIAAGSVTAAELAGVTFDSLTFAVKTQAQLDTVLAAVPAETPLAIDPEGATENLMVTTGNRKIYVMLPKNGTYKVRQGGLMIIVK